MGDMPKGMVSLPKCISPGGGENPSDRILFLSSKSLFVMSPIV